MTLVLTAARHLTPAGRLAEGACGVVVDGDRISYVGDRARALAVAGPDARHVDAPRGTLLPGFVDAHVHLLFDAGDHVVRGVLTQDDAAHRRGIRQRLADLLAAGVTTVRDLGDRDGLVAAVRAEPGIAPRVLTAREPLTVPNGHCWFLGGVVADRRDLRHRVRAHADAGADVIKVMVSGGHLTPGSPPPWQSQWGQEELRIVVGEARRLGLPVAAHAHGTQAIRDCVRVGVATVEHASWSTPDGPVLDRAVLTEAADKGVALSPCVSGLWDLPRFPHRRFRVDAVRAAVEHGVALAVGTDCGLRGVRPGRSYLDGLRIWAEIGFDVPGLLRLASTATARQLGIDSWTGSLSTGKKADVLLLDGDPRAGIAELDAPRLVVVDGRPHRPEVIRA